MRKCENGKTGGRRSHCGKGGVSLLWVYRREGVPEWVERREKGSVRKVCQSGLREGRREVLGLKDER